jgi:hypothetical protein
MLLLLQQNLGFAWGAVSVVTLNLGNATTQALTANRVTRELTPDRITRAVTTNRVTEAL